MKKFFTSLKVALTLFLLCTVGNVWGVGTLVSALSEIEDGATYYIAAFNSPKYYTVPNTTISAQTFTCTEGTLSGSTLTPASGAGEFKFTKVSNVDNAFYIYNTNLKKYLVATGSKTFGYVEDTSTDYGYWTFSTVTSGGFSGQFSVKHSSKTHYMRAYNNSVRCYDGQSNNGVYLFKLSNTATISSNPSSVTFDQKELKGTVSDSKSITVTGSNLTSGITASIKEDNSIFSVSPSSLGTTGGEITVSYSADTKGEYSGTVVLSSEGAANYEISVSVNIIDPLPVLQSIYITGTASKTTYQAGDSFDPTGLKVMGKYDKGNDTEITSGITWAFDPETFEEGNTSVKVTATVSGKNSEPVTVENITVTEAPLKVTYDFNDAESYSEGFPTEGTNVATAQTFKFDGNDLIINAPNSYYQINSANDASRALFFGKSATTLSDNTAYLEFPAKSGYKITNVKATTSSGIAGSVKFNIYDTKWTAMSTDQTTVSSTSKEYSFDLTNPEENTAYRLAASTSGKNLQFFSIVLTYTKCAEDLRETPTASFESETVNAVVDDNVTITVTTNSDGTVTYSSSDEDVAMVDPSTGEVLAISAGTATIKAEIAGTTTYKPTSASYTIVITSAPLTGKGTEAEPYTVGDIIALGSNGEECWVGGTIVGFGVSEKQLDNSYKLNYTTDAEKFSQSNFVISDGNGKIAAVELPSGTDIRTALNLPEHLNYIGAPIKVYGKLTSYFSQVGVKSTSDYKLTQQNVTISNVGYATACIPFDATVEGATAYYVTIDGEKATLNEITGTIPAGTGIILKGSEGTVKFTETSVAATTDVTANCLVGTTKDGGEDFTDGTKYEYYIFANDANNGLGFYKKAEGGVTKCAQYKAVLEVPAENAGAKSFFLFEETVGIENVNATKAENNVMYNLAGQRVTTAKGIVIINGKKVIK